MWFLEPQCGKNRNSVSAYYKPGIEQGPSIMPAKIFVREQMRDAYLHLELLLYSQPVRPW